MQDGIKFKICYPSASVLNFESPNFVSNTGNSCDPSSHTNTASQKNNVS